MTRPRRPLALLLLASCATPALPEGEGKGILALDGAPPPGVESFARPEWRQGDRFVYRRGGRIRLAFRVDSAGADGYRCVEEVSLMTNSFTRDLWEAGQERDGVPEATRALAPPDPMLTWPLWEGKRWSGHLLSKAPGRPAIPLQVSYHCDRVETVHVPAGSFRALRIWRNVTVAAEGDYVVRTSLRWYAPEVGFLVRRLDDGVLTDLEEFHRQ
jgi:hypothetical protein